MNSNFEVVDGSKINMKPPIDKHPKTGARQFSKVGDKAYRASKLWDNLSKGK